VEKPLDKIFTVDDSIRKVQMDKLHKVKSERDNKKVQSLLTQLEADARSNVNLMPGILAACEAYASLGEIADVFRKVFGEYKAN
jgi:methylmalonyl-CoA mutase N-terminal domain/subunit